MKLALALTALAVLSLAACQSPVSNAQTVTSSSSSLPLGQGSRVTVYAATADGNGVQMFSSTATNWVTLDWSGLYHSVYNSANGWTYPPVYDVFVTSAGVVYAATRDGLIVGSGSRWTTYLAGTRLNAVSVNGGYVFVSNSSGLSYSTGSLAAWNSLISGVSVSQWTAWGNAGVAATAQGIYYSSTTTGTYALPTVTGTALNAGTVNTVYAPGSTLYAGTSLGYSTTSPSGTFNWTNTTGSSSVNGILVSNGTTYLATATGLLSAGNWQFSGVGVNNIVAGYPGTNNYYFSNGPAGLGILQFDSSGNPSANLVLTWANVSKVFVTTP